MRDAETEKGNVSTTSNDDVVNWVAVDDARRASGAYVGTVPGGTHVGPELDQHTLPTCASWRDGVHLAPSELRQGRPMLG